jgi:hypothetical protein
MSDSASVAVDNDTPVTKDEAEAAYAPLLAYDVALSIEVCITVYCNN